MEAELLSVDGKRYEVLRVSGGAASAAGAASMRGGAGAPTLVFLHEGLGCAQLWRDFPARLSAALSLPALIYSRLGYGASDPTPLPRPLTYMEDEARVLLPRLLEVAGIERAILIGHSDGASIALVHAALDAGAAPQAEGVRSEAPGRRRVLALALEAPHVFVEDVALASIARARDAFEHGALRARLSRWHGANVEVAFRGWNDAWLDPGFPAAFQLGRWLPAVRVPTLILQGEDDDYGTLAQVDEIERGVSGPFERVILPACGHAPHKDRPEETLAAMARFVARVLDRG